jgi:dethiobiotin synthetase/adenosylmethionine--8-amino-7-oxononanoate aminotransferase
VPDAEVARAVARELRAFGGAGAASSASPPPLSIVETAGGVLSPGVSGAPQADVLRPLRLPALLVGDARLGGISATLCAYESLALRGHDVAAVVLLEREEGGGGSGGEKNADLSLGNAAALRAALADAAAHRMGESLPVLTLPPVPPPGEGADPAAAAVDAGVRAWLREAGPRLRALLAEVDASHARRLRDLRTSAARASACVWWPFTQHGALPAAAEGGGAGNGGGGANRGVTVVDGRAGEDWLVFREGDNDTGSPPPTPTTNPPSLRPAYDAASSWWTQVASGARAQNEVTRALASAAGRYAHVMWPQVAHAPGLRLAEELVQGPLGRGWASRCFFSDDGSTGVEVALKAAMRRFALDRGMAEALWPDTPPSSSQASGSGGDGAPEPPAELGVLALANGYHGDTLGAMDCAAPSPFNGPGQFPWYRGGSRGSLFLEPPYVALERGRWVARLPAWLQEDDEGGERGGGASDGESDDGDGLGLEWPSRADLFDLPRRARSRLARRYARAVVRLMDAHEEAQGREDEDEDEASAAAASSSSHRPRHRNNMLAAVLLEPVLQGAGGMLMVDPLFQAVLAREARRTRGLPIVYDEVFSGCWRLGVPRAADLLRLGDATADNDDDDDNNNWKNKDPSLPDVAVYAKLLTGGAAPLAATLATERVFSAFSHASSLARALLHGHSYTAYPAGCAAALASLHVLRSPGLNPNVCAPPAQPQLTPPLEGQGGTCQRGGGCSCLAPCGRLLDLWSEADACELSRHRLVRRVVAIGTVLAVEVRGVAELEAQAGNAGGSSPCPPSPSYTSGRSASAAVVEAMRARGFAARPLGPVVYVVATPTAPRDACARAVGELRAALDDVLRSAAAGGDGGGSVGGGATAACLV